MIARFALPIGLLLVLSLPLPAQAEDPPAPLARASRSSTDDLPAMRKRHEIRALVTYDRTNYVIDQGQERGFEYELL